MASPPTADAGSQGAATSETVEQTPQPAEPARDAGPRRPPHATARIVAERRAAASDLVDRLVIEKKIVIVRPDDQQVAHWRKVVDFAKRHSIVPEGFRIEKFTTWQKDLEISLLVGTHPNSAPTSDSGLPPIPPPEDLNDLHPVVAALEERPDRLHVCTDCLPRVLKILQALATATVELGHAIEPGKSDEAVMTFQVHESRYEITIEESYEEAPATEQPKYDWQRITTFEQLPTGRLELYLLPRKGYLLGRHYWGDRKRWTLEDKLPEVLSEIVGRGVTAEQARLAKERAEADRRQRWEAAMKQARHDFRRKHRATRLRDQIERWREAQEINAFCDAAEQSMAAMAEGDLDASAVRWIAWARSCAARIDPLQRALRFPEDPKPTPQDLAPFLDGWNPYGPR